jgi:hypothetical protein
MSHCPQPSCMKAASIVANCTLTTLINTGLRRIHYVDWICSECGCHVTSKVDADTFFAASLMLEARPTLEQLRFDVAFDEIVEDL